MKLLQKIINALKPVSQAELNEQYLNQSTSIQELEWRMRQLEQRTYDANRSYSNFR